MYVPESLYNRVYSYGWVEFSFFADFVTRVTALDFSYKCDRELMLTYLEILTTRNALIYQEFMPENYTFVTTRIPKLNQVITNLKTICNLPKNTPDELYFNYFEKFRNLILELNEFLIDDSIAFHTNKFASYFGLKWQ